MEPRWKYKYNPESCIHKNTGDIGTKHVQHIICYDCCHHWYQGKEYTHKEMEAWVNQEEEDE